MRRHGRSPEGRGLCRGEAWKANIFSPSGTDCSRNQRSNGKKLRARCFYGLRIQFSMNAYLLPCACGADIPVSAAQAGGQIGCPACGRLEAVPKLRDLGQLPRAAAEAVVGRRATAAGWTILHTLLLAGSLLAIGCGLGSMLVTPPEFELLDSAVLQASVNAASATDVITAFRTRLEMTALERPLTEQEAKSLNRSTFYTRLRDGLRAAALLGALAAVGGGVGILAGRGGKPTAPPGDLQGRRR